MESTELRWPERRRTLALVLFFGLFSAAASAQTAWRGEWPRTDFTQHTVLFEEIESGGPPKDGIPAIDRPRFVSQKEAARWLDAREPVIVFEHRGEARAYPLQILMFHEIVNDTVGSTPVAVTFCPLCNASIVFDRRLDGAVLDFGTTGKLRKSDLVMYDRQTESWWQQFTGKGIVDRETRSAWDIFGRAVDGPLKGERLAPTDSGVHFAFAWLAFNPATEIYVATTGPAANNGGRSR